MIFYDIFSFADLIFQITAGSTLTQYELDAEKLPMHPWGQARFVPGSWCFKNERMQNDPELCCSSKKTPCETLDQNKMQPTNPKAHTYVNGTDAEAHGYAVAQNTF